MNISQLNHRERLLLAVGGVTVLIILLCFGILAPYFDSLERIDAQIGTRHRQLKEMQQLQTDYRQYLSQRMRGEQQVADNRDFSLLSFLETTAAQFAGRDNLIAMRPQPAMVQNGYKEEIVELKLEKLSLTRLVRLLHAMESNGAPVRIRSLRIKSRFDDRNLLDVTATIGSPRRVE